MTTKINRHAGKMLAVEWAYGRRFENYDTWKIEYQG